MAKTNLTDASVTPLPYRKTDTPEQVSRNQNEIELWLNLVSVIYQVDGAITSNLNAGDPTLILQRPDVPCPVPLRLELHGTWNPKVFSSATNGQGLILYFNVSPLKGGQPGSGFASSASYAWVPALSVDQLVEVPSLASYDVEQPGVYQVQLLGLLQYGPPAPNAQINASSLLVLRGRKPPS